MLLIKTGNFGRIGRELNVFLWGLFSKEVKQFKKYKSYKY